MPPKHQTKDQNKHTISKQLKFVEIEDFSEIPQVEEVRLEVAVKLRQCIEQLGGKAVDLFQIIAKGEDVASVEEDPRGKMRGTK